MGGSRDKMIRSAASLIGRRGMNATSFSDVLEESGVSRGSIYHHFPHGKRQLAECAMRLTSDQVIAHLNSCTAATPEGVLDHFVALFRQVIVATAGAAGCAVAGVTVDVTEDDEGLLAVARETFQAWISLLAAQLEIVGVTSERAHAVAVLSVASVEGALILARSEGSDASLRVVGEQLALLVRD